MLAHRLREQCSWRQKHVSICHISSKGMKQKEVKFGAHLSLFFSYVGLTSKSWDDSIHIQGGSCVLIKPPWKCSHIIKDSVSLR